MVLYHVVLAKLPSLDDREEAAKLSAEWIKRFSALKCIDTVMSIKCGTTLRETAHRNKGYRLCAVIEVENSAALKTYAEHDEHRNFVEWARNSGIYDEDSPLVVDLE